MATHMMSQISVSSEAWLKVVEVRRADGDCYNRTQVQLQVGHNRDQMTHFFPIQEWERLACFLKTRGLPSPLVGQIEKRLNVDRDIWVCFPWPATELISTLERIRAAEAS